MARRRRDRKTLERAPQVAQPAESAGVWGAILPLIVLAAGLVAFLPAIRAEFVDYDDNKLFTENTDYRGFDKARLKWMFKTTFMGHYQPLTWMSAAVDYKLGWDAKTKTLSPVPFHLNNLILHALNGMLLYFVSLRLIRAAVGAAATSTAAAGNIETRGATGPRQGMAIPGLWLRGAAAVAALTWAVHPLRVESVAWASERRDVLSVFFLLSATLAYLRTFPAARSPGGSRPYEVSGASIGVASWGWYVASWGLLLLSLLSKAWGMSFFVVMAVLDVYPLRRLHNPHPDPLPKRERGSWFTREAMIVHLQKLPYALLGLWAMFKAGQAQDQALGTMKSLEDWGIADRVTQACYGLVFYVWKTIWPTRLAALYELPKEMDHFAPQYIACYVMLAVAGVALVLLRRRLPGLVTAAVIYVIVVSPVLGFAQSGPQFVAFKYSYVCCMGWSIVAGGALLILWRNVSLKSWRIPADVVAAAALALLLTLSWRHTKVWNNSRSLWDYALNVAVIESSIAHMNYGRLMDVDTESDEKIRHYRKSLWIDPENGGAWYNLGNTLKKRPGKADQKRQDYLEAIDAFKEAVKGERMVEKHKGYQNLGNTYWNQLHDLDAAIEAYRRALDHVEKYKDKMWTSMPYLLLGKALKAKGDFAGAEPYLRAAAKHRETQKQALQELKAMGAK